MKLPGVAQLQRHLRSIISAGEKKKKEAPRASFSGGKMAQQESAHRLADKRGARCASQGRAAPLTPPTPVRQPPQLAPLKDFMFLNSLRLTAKPKGRHRDFPQTLASIDTQLPPPSASPPGGALVTAHEPTLTINTTPSPWLTLGFPLGVVRFMGLSKCIITCIYHYGIMRSVFTDLKILCAPPPIPPSPQLLATIDPFTVSIVVTFPDVI